MGYDGVNFKKIINIGKIFSIHYFEYMSNFTFVGESHNFWEFVCVDKGEVGITSGSSYIILKKDEIIFHHPYEFHNVAATGTVAPNLVVISFECNDEAMSFFKKRILKIDETERNILANIIIEARRCFACRLDDPYLQNMPLREKEFFGSGQMIKNYLEQFLIHMIRRYSQSVVLSKRPALTTKTTKKKSDEEVFHRIVDYLENNMTTHITIEQICHDNLIGRSQLQKIFKEKTGLGIIEYFSHMKIEAAKELIRTNHMNFTQVSEYLGYTSIHYFSRQFKKLTGMTPSEYASSIKAVAERGF